MTDAAERTVEGDVFASGTAEPFAAADVVVAADAHTELVNVFGRRIQYKYVVAIVYVTALFLDILDTTIVNVAIPALGEQFQSGMAEWVVLGYTVSLAVWIPASGWLGDRFGTKRIFLFALAAFTLGSLLCSLSTSMGQLILFRVLQGVGGGMLTPVGIAMLFRAFPPAERAKAAMIVIIPALCAPAAGPVLGGLLVTHASWHWIFLINVPIGIVAFLFGWKNLREHKEEGSGRFDVPGFVFSGAALALIVFALSDGPSAGWGSKPVVVSGVLGVLCAIALVYTELHVERPMLDLRLLANHMFRMCNIVGLLSMASFLGLTFVMPLYLQLLTRPGCVDERPNDLPTGVRDHDLDARRWAHLPEDRAEAIDGGWPVHRRPDHLHVHADRPRHQPVDRPRPHVPARSVHGLRVRTDAGRDLRDDLVGRHRAGELDLLDAAADRCVPRRGHHGQHPHRPYGARPLPECRRDRHRAHRLSLGVRNRSPACDPRCLRRSVHP